MENITEWLISIGIAFLSIIGGWLLSQVQKMSIRFREKMWAVVEKYLNENLPEMFKGVLVNVYQTQIKNIYKTEEWTPDKKREVFTIALSQLIVLLPNFILKLLKKYKSDWENYLRQRMQQYLEEHKAKINVAEYVPY